VAVFVKQLGAVCVDNARKNSPEWIWPSASAAAGGGYVNFNGGFRRVLHDRKGGDWSEWPEDLRVREFPA
jgi:hypothetical protein